MTNPKNVVTLQGRVANDIFTSENMVRFNLAVQRNFKNKEGNYDADFVSCTMFGEKNIENAKKYFQKGKALSISGSVRTGSYDKDGKTVYTTDIVVDSWSFTDGSSKPSDTEESKAEKYEKSDDGEFMTPPDDDALPFETV